MASQSSQNPPVRSSIVTPPPVSSNKQYGNKHVDAELEALKQRGLAKMLNKHFTETALQLESEKAAADAALLDLEQRKANTSEFVAANYNGVSPLDEMAIQANKWRAECRRKERETMLLYQRYVHRFGDTLHSIVPHATPDSPLTSAPPPRKAPIDTLTSPSTQVPNMAAQIEATLEEYLKQGAVSVPSMQILGKDETYQTAHQKEEEQFRNFYRRQLEDKGIDVKYNGFSITGRPDFPGFPIHTIDEQNHHNNDDDSVVSGLTTLHSVIIQDCERSVVTYLQEEHEKIQKLVAHDEYDDEIDEDASAVSQAESMVQQMEEILAEYQTNRSHATNAQHHEPREYKTDNPNECWMIHYDEFYQQDYYHETNTNRTQWEPPNNDSTSCTSSATTQLTVSEVMPDMKVYRQRRRAKRRSRVSGLGVLVVLMLAAVIALYGNSPLVRDYVPKAWLQYLPQHQQSPARTVSVKSTTTNKSVVVPIDIKTEPVVSTEKAAVAPFVPPPMERFEEQDPPRDDVTLRRPWLCNLPFACWIHPRCWMLARRNPIYDAEGFITTMWL